MRNIINEFKDARDRANEYIEYVLKYPKPERDEISEAILRSYRGVLFKWFSGMLGVIFFNGLVGLVTKSLIHS